MFYMLPFYDTWVFQAMKTIFSRGLVYILATTRSGGFLLNAPLNISSKHEMSTWIMKENSSPSSDIHQPATNLASSMSQHIQKTLAILQDPSRASASLLRSRQSSLQPGSHCHPEAQQMLCFQNWRWFSVTEWIEHWQCNIHCTYLALALRPSHIYTHLLRPAASLTIY